LGRAVVPVGFIEQVRLVIANEDDAVVLDVMGTVETAKVPSGPRTGFKIVPKQTLPFPIREGQTTAIRAFFDPAKQVVHNPGQGFIFKPTIPGEMVPPETLVVIPDTQPGSSIPLPAPDFQMELEAVRATEITRDLIFLIDHPNAEVIVRGTLRRTREVSKSGIRYRWESSNRIFRVSYYLRPCLILVKTVMYR